MRDACEQIHNTHLLYYYSGFEFDRPICAHTLIEKDVKERKFCINSRDVGQQKLSSNGISQNWEMHIKQVKNFIGSKSLEN